MSGGFKRYPRLHNAMWPGLVGKGTPGAEPYIDLDTMLQLTVQAEVNGERFEGVDLFLYLPHIDIDIDEEGIKRLAEKIASYGLVVGSVVAPVWPPTGGGSAIGDQHQRKAFLTQLRKACFIATKLRELGIRPYGVVRIDSACSPAEFLADPLENTKRLVNTFKEACKIASDYGEVLAAEGEICWGGLHSWRWTIRILEEVGEPERLGFQADMAHTLLYILGYNSPEDRLVPEQFQWEAEILEDAYKKLTAALRPWTVDLHVAQNDATVKGSGTHDKTGRHCLPDDPNGKLNIPYHAGFWLRDEKGNLIKRFKHICWDGCMFPNEVMLNPKTWQNILKVMVKVREMHGWEE